MSETLKECPFCGNYPVYVVDKLEGVFIVCLSCKIRTAGYFDDRQKELPTAIRKVRESWNKRIIK